MNVPEAPATAPPAVASTPVAPSPAAPPAVASAPVPARPAPTFPEALEAPEPAPEVDDKTPWADVGYVGWMNGTSREKAPVFDTKFFTPEIRLDMNYLQSCNHPQDHTIVGSTEEFRSGEFQIEQASVGGDFHWQNVPGGRIIFMQGLIVFQPPRHATMPVRQLAPIREIPVESASGTSSRRLTSMCRKLMVGYHFNNSTTD